MKTAKEVIEFIKNVPSHWNEEQVMNKVGDAIERLSEEEQKVVWAWFEQC